MINFFKTEDAEYNQARSVNLDKCVVGCNGKEDLISLDKANRLLMERGQVCYGNLETSQNIFMFCDPKDGLRDKNCSHRALLINIEPIEKPDMAEKILKDFMSQVDQDFGMSSQWESLVSRARKLIGGRTKR